MGLNIFLIDGDHRTALKLFIMFKRPKLHRQTISLLRQCFQRFQIFRPEDFQLDHLILIIRIEAGNPTIRDFVDTASPPIRKPRNIDSSRNNFKKASHDKPPWV
jgi:hypothetical protein